MRIPNLTSQMDGATPSMLEILTQSARDASGQINSEPSAEAMLAALENFMANNSQAGVMPGVRHRLSRAIDELALSGIMDKGMEKNPGILDILFGSGEFAPEGSEIMGSMGVPTKGSSLDELAASVYANPGEVESGYTPEQIQQLEKLIQGSRDTVGRNSAGQEYRDLIDAVAPEGNDDPALFFDRLLGAMQANNMGRSKGNMGAGPYRTAADREFRDFGPDFVDMGAVSDDAAMSGDYSDLASVGDPMIESLRMLKMAGLSDEEIADTLMRALAEFDDAQVAGGLREDMGSLAGDFDPEALLGELVDVPRKDKTRLPDTDIIMRAMGLD